MLDFLVWFDRFVCLVYFLLQEVQPMTRKSTNMKHIREILRLKRDHKLTNADIARSLSIGRTTVRECLRRAFLAGVNWPIPESLDDLDLEALLYPSAKSKDTQTKQEGLDLEKIHKELKRKNMTLYLLWDEYRQINSNGYMYSQFCKLYRNWAGQKDLWMPQVHKVGEKMFVDYTGITMPITNPKDGSIYKAQIFVAVLGASLYVYAEATMSQTLQDWISSHCNAFKFFGGVPEIVIPDNLRSAINKAHIYEPEENPTYQEMASHYGVVIMAARVRKPKDKPLVEQAVQQVERQILAPLRDRKFFNLNELNYEIKPLLEKMNKKSFQKISGSRWSQFEEIEKAALKPLPETAYEYAEWQKARANKGYMVFVGEHYYSVPYQYADKKVDVRSTKNMVEIFYKSKRITSHRRNYKKGGKTILKEHMPKSHLKFAEWTPEKILETGSKIGEQTKTLFIAIIKKSGHAVKGARICLGILRLEKCYGKERLEAACRRAFCIGGFSLKSVESILKNGLDLKEFKKSDQSAITNVCHENIRGDNYYQ